MEGTDYKIPNNLYHNKLGDNRWVYFNPDSFGGVVVLRDEVKSIIDNRNKTNPNKEAIVNVLIEKGILYSLGIKKNEFNKVNNKSVSYWFHITNKCNLRCSYCYINKNNESMSLELAKISLRKIIADCQKENIKKIGIKFAGGEPVLEIQLIGDIIKYARKIAPFGISINFGIITNGTLISAEVAKFLKNSSVLVSVSLDGPQTCNDKTRISTDGSGTHAKIVRGILHLRKEKLNPLILSVISPTNYNCLAEFMRWLIENDLNSRFSFCRDEHIVKAHSIQRINDDLTFNMLEAYNILGKYLPSRPLDQFHNIGNLSFKRPIIRYCGVGINGFAVSHKGHFAYCQETIENTVSVLPDENHFEILRNKNPNKKNVDDYEGCNNCQWKHVCGGDCIVLKNKYFNKHNCSSPYCKTFKKVIPKLIDLRGLQLIKAGDNLLNKPAERRGNGRDYS